VWGHAAFMAKMRNTHKILARKPKGKILLWRLRHGWEGTITVYIKESE
jgi:hypothetical protein